MKLNDITIKVRKFGPLENVSFKLAPMMIFTGKSSLGKSYANYLVYYFLFMVCNGRLHDYIGEIEGKDEENHEYVFSLDAFLGELSANVESFMRKFLGDDGLHCEVSFKMLKRTRTLGIAFEKLPTDEIDDETKEVAMPHGAQPYALVIDGIHRRELPSLEYAKFYATRQIQYFILGETITRAIILPPGRGAFAGESFTLKNDVASSLNMYNYYFRDYDYSISSRLRFQREAMNDMYERLLNLTSGGNLVNVDGKQYLQINEQERIALSAGASSVKDLSPWLFFLKNHWMSTFSFCMEEPEAHQHPSVTIQIADVMAMAMHIRESNMFHLTTHSDYLLQRINQLIKLGSIRRKNKAMFKRICEERDLDLRSYLDAKDIQAYFFSKNEKGKTVVESLEITDDGIPMKSFFEVVSDLDDREEYINAAVYRLSKEEA